MPCSSVVREALFKREAVVSAGCYSSLGILSTTSAERRAQQDAARAEKAGARASVQVQAVVYVHEQQEAARHGQQCISSRL
ncbi:hypothetical protein QJQ45_017070 [Haematococcus lacustris]|nr:hypothetical protein QJQ45_017070 [Haematococcus lacustris]